MDPQDLAYRCHCQWQGMDPKISQAEDRQPTTQQAETSTTGKCPSSKIEDAVIPPTKCMNTAMGTQRCVTSSTRVFTATKSHYPVTQQIAQ